MTDPKRPWLRLLAAAVGAVLTCSLTAVPAAAAPPAEPAVPVLTWTDCGDGFQCATADVPLDYDRPGETIELALIRRPADDPSRRIGSLFTNPGGPGGSGVDFVRSSAAFGFDPEVLARFDVVGFDPRGVGASSPFRCFDSTEEQAAFLTARSAAPITRDEERATTRTNIEFGARCVARNPRIAGHLSTANVARDLHLLMRAVGDTELSYYGLSYGTYLGATFAALFPGDVRSLVLDGVVDPDAYAGVGPDGRQVPTFVRVGSNIGSGESLNAFLDLCAEVGEASCAFGGGDPAAKFAELADRLRAGPITVPDGAGGEIELTYGTVVGLVNQLLYSDLNYPLLGQLLQDLYTDDRAATEAAFAELNQLFAAEPTYSNTPEAQQAILCTDTENPRNPAAWPELGRAAEAATPNTGLLWAWLSQPCATWPARDQDRYTGPFDVATANPVLVVGTRFDPPTPYRNAVALAETLPGAELLTLEGYGHTSFGQGQCVTSAIGKYLLTGDTPAGDATCFPDRQPFDPLPGAPSPADRFRLDMVPTVGP